MKPSPSSGRARSHRGAVVAITAVVVWLLPVLWLISVSLKKQVDLFVRTPKLLFHPFPHNFVSALTDYGIIGDALHSLIIAGAATAISLALASLMTYGLTKFAFRGRSPILMWILTLRMLPPIAIVIPYYLLYNDYGLIDTFPGLILAYLPIAVPLAVWLMYGFVRDLPRSIDEAALLDGSSSWQTFWHISLPLMRPALAVTGIFCFLEVWNEFVLALILTGSHTKTVSIGMSEFITEHAIVWGPMAAASLLLLLPLLAITYALQRHMVKGLTLGAVK